jgi:hypothetical protein
MQDNFLISRTISTSDVWLALLKYVVGSPAFHKAATKKFGVLNFSCRLLYCRCTEMQTDACCTQPLHDGKYGDHKQQFDYCVLLLPLSRMREKQSADLHRQNGRRRPPLLSRERLHEMRRTEPLAALRLACKLFLHVTL